MHKKAAFIFLAVFATALAFVGLAYVFTQLTPKDPAIAEGLVPHQAVYDITLVSRKSASSVVNISGRLTYSWFPACDVWTTHHSYELRYDNSDGSVQEIDSAYTTEEAFDGSYLEFTSERRTFGEVIEEYQGVAERPVRGPLIASYTIPEPMTKEMPADTLFPIAHSLSVVKQMKKGGNPIFLAKVFDGSDAQGEIEVNTVIGGEDVNYVPLDVALQPDPPRKLRLAFFTKDEDNPEQAGYEMDVLMHQNGIISDMKIEYPDFAIRQTLVELAPLEAQCDRE